MHTISRVAFLSNKHIFIEIAKKRKSLIFPKAFSLFYFHFYLYVIVQLFLDLQDWNLCILS